MLVLALAATQAIAASYSRPIRGAIEAIRNEAPRDGLPCLHGYLEGYPGHTGAYLLYFPKIYGNATKQDLELMLKDPSPTVRLTGAMVLIQYRWRLPAFDDLAKDATLLSVGPFPRSKEMYRSMKVSEVLREMQYDHEFLLRSDSATSVRLDYVREVSVPAGSSIVIGRLPEYQLDMARAGIDGEVTVKISFAASSATPEIQILKASHREFAEAVIWALSKWELKKSEGAPAASVPTEFECRVVFKATE